MSFFQNRDMVEVEKGGWDKFDQKLNVLQAALTYRSLSKQKNAWQAEQNK